MIVDDGKTSRNRMQIGTLLNAIEEEGFPPPSVAVGGRGEGPRQGASTPTATSSASGTPRCSVRSFWSLYNGRIHPGEHMRIFPLSNWTEADIWHYIREKIEIPSIYFSHQRQVIERDGMLLSASDAVQPRAARPSPSAPCASAPSAT